jgi:hypothetical protein
MTREWVEQHGQEFDVFFTQLKGVVENSSIKILTDAILPDLEVVGEDGRSYCNTLPKYVAVASRVPELFAQLVIEANPKTAAAFSDLLSRFTGDNFPQFIERVKAFLLSLDSADVARLVFRGLMEDNLVGRNTGAFRDDFTTAIHLRGVLHGRTKKLQLPRQILLEMGKRLAPEDGVGVLQSCIGLVQGTIKLHTRGLLREFIRDTVLPPFTDTVEQVEEYVCSDTFGAILKAFQGTPMITVLHALKLEEYSPPFRAAIVTAMKAFSECLFNLLREDDIMFDQVIDAVATRSADALPLAICPALEQIAQANVDKIELAPLLGSLALKIFKAVLPFKELGVFVTFATAVSKPDSKGGKQPQKAKVKGKEGAGAADHKAKLDEEVAAELRLGEASNKLAKRLVGLQVAHKGFLLGLCSTLSTDVFEPLGLIHEATVLVNKAIFRIQEKILTFATTHVRNELAKALQEVPLDRKLKEVFRPAVTDTLDYAIKITISHSSVLTDIVGDLLQNCAEGLKGEGVDISVFGENMMKPLREMFRVDQLALDIQSRFLYNLNQELLLDAAMKEAESMAQKAVGWVSGLCTQSMLMLAGDSPQLGQIAGVMKKVFDQLEQIEAKKAAAAPALGAAAVPTQVSQMLQAPGTPLLRRMEHTVRGTKPAVKQTMRQMALMMEAVTETPQDEGLAEMPPLLVGLDSVEEFVVALLDALPLPKVRAFLQDSARKDKWMTKELKGKVGQFLQAHRARALADDVGFMDSKYHQSLWGGLFTVVLQHYTRLQGVDAGQVGRELLLTAWEDGKDLLRSKDLVERVRKLMEGVMLTKVGEVFSLKTLQQLQEHVLGVVVPDELQGVLSGIVAVVSTPEAIAKFVQGCIAVVTSQLQGTGLANTLMAKKIITDKLPQWAGTMLHSFTCFLQSRRLVEIQQADTTRIALLEQLVAVLTNFQVMTFEKKIELLHQFYDIPAIASRFVQEIMDVVLAPHKLIANTVLVPIAQPLAQQVQLQFLRQMQDAMLGSASELVWKMISRDLAAVTRTVDGAISAQGQLIINTAVAPTLHEGILRFMHSWAFAGRNECETLRIFETFPLLLPSTKAGVFSKLVQGLLDLKDKLEVFVPNSVTRVLLKLLADSAPKGPDHDLKPEVVAMALNRLVELLGDPVWQRVGKFDAGQEVFRVFVGALLEPLFEHMLVQKPQALLEALHKSCAPEGDAGSSQPTPDQIAKFAATSVDCSLYSSMLFNMQRSLPPAITKWVQSSKVTPNMIAPLFKIAMGTQLASHEAAASSSAPPQPPSAAEAAVVGTAFLHPECLGPALASALELMAKNPYSGSFADFVMQAKDSVVELLQHNQALAQRVFRELRKTADYALAKFKGNYAADPDAAVRSLSRHECELFLSDTLYLVLVLPITLSCDKVLAAPTDIVELVTVGSKYLQAMSNLAKPLTDLVVYTFPSKGQCGLDCELGIEAACWYQDFAMGFFPVLFTPQTLGSLTTLLYRPVDDSPTSQKLIQTWLADHIQAVFQFFRANKQELTERVFSKSFAGLQEAVKNACILADAVEATPPADLVKVMEEFLRPLANSLTLHVDRSIVPLIELAVLELDQASAGQVVDILCRVVTSSQEVGDIVQAMRSLTATDVSSSLVIGPQGSMTQMVTGALTDSKKLMHSVGFSCVQTTLDTAGEVVHTVLSCSQEAMQNISSFLGKTSPEVAKAMTLAGGVEKQLNDIFLYISDQVFEKIQGDCVDKTRSEQQVMDLCRQCTRDYIRARVKTVFGVKKGQLALYVSSGIALLTLVFSFIFLGISLFRGFDILKALVNSLLVAAVAFITSYGQIKSDSTTFNQLDPKVKSFMLYSFKQLLQLSIVKEVSQMVVQKLQEEAQ